MKNNPNPTKSCSLDYNKELDEALLQYHAEQRQGLNELAGNGTADEQLKQRLKSLLAKTELEIAKAYGGCTICYGKGYATVTDMWSGLDTDTDIGSPGGTVLGGSTNAMKFCTCDRGKQLEKRVAQARIDGAIEELEILRYEYNWGESGEDFNLIRVDRLDTLREERSKL